MIKKQFHVFYTEPVGRSYVVKNKQVTVELDENVYEDAVHIYETIAKEYHLDVVQIVGVVEGHPKVW